MDTWIQVDTRLNHVFQDTGYCGYYVLRIPSIADTSTLMVSAILDTVSTPGRRMNTRMVGGWVCRAWRPAGGVAAAAGAATASDVAGGVAAAADVAPGVAPGVAPHIGLLPLFSGHKYM